MMQHSNGPLTVTLTLTFLFLTSCSSTSPRYPRTTAAYAAQLAMSYEEGAPLKSQQMYRCAMDRSNDGTLPKVGLEEGDLAPRRDAATKHWLENLYRDLADYPGSESALATFLGLQSEEFEKYDVSEATVSAARKSLAEFQLRSLMESTDEDAFVHRLIVLHRVLEYLGNTLETQALVQEADKAAALVQGRLDEQSFLSTSHFYQSVLLLAGREAKMRTDEPAEYVRRNTLTVIHVRTGKIAEGCEAVYEEIKQIERNPNLKARPKLTFDLEVHLDECYARSRLGSATVTTTVSERVQDGWEEGTGTEWVEVEQEMPVQSQRCISTSTNGRCSGYATMSDSYKTTRLRQVQVRKRIPRYRTVTKELESKVAADVFSAGVEGHVIVKHGTKQDRIEINAKKYKKVTEGEEPPKNFEQSVRFGAQIKVSNFFAKRKKQLTVPLREEAKRLLASGELEAAAGLAWIVTKIEGRDSTGVMRKAQNLGEQEWNEIVQNRFFAYAKNVEIDEGTCPE